MEKISCTHALMSVARCICNYGNCFVGKYFVVYFSTTKTTKILTPEKYPLYGIYRVAFCARSAQSSLSAITSLFKIQISVKSSKDFALDARDFRKYRTPSGEFSDKKSRYSFVTYINL